MAIKMKYRFYGNDSPECSWSVDQGTHATEIRVKGVTCHTQTFTKNTLIEGWTETFAYLTIRDGKALLSDEQIMVPYVPENVPPITGVPPHGQPCTGPFTPPSSTTPGVATGTGMTADEYQGWLDASKKPAGTWAKERAVPYTFVTNDKWDTVGIPVVNPNDHTWDMPITISDDFWTSLKDYHEEADKACGADPAFLASVTKAAKFEYKDPMFYEDPFITYNKDAQVPTRAAADVLAPTEGINGINTTTNCTVQGVITLMKETEELF